MQWLRSLVFTAFMFAWSFTYAVIFVIVAPFVPVKRRFGLAAWYARRMMNALRLICGLDFEVTGAENFPAVPHVALWKHGSAWETFAQFRIGPPKVPPNCDRLKLASGRPRPLSKKLLESSFELRRNS